MACGEFQEQSRITLHEYALEWTKRYQGRGRRGFHENTRDEYERGLKRWALVYFPERTRLTDISPSMVAGFVGWLCEQTKARPTKEEPDRRVPFSDSTVRNIVKPLRACLATAVREGLIRSNPARDVDLPQRPTVEGSEQEDVRAMSRDGHAIHYDESGAVIGLTLLNVRRSLEQDGSLTLTLPQEHLAADAVGPILAAA